MKNLNVGAEHRYLFHEGKDNRAYEYFGAHPVSDNPADGIIFRVWAPRAEWISLVGDFNGWKDNTHPMERNPEDESIWEILVQEAKIGDYYKYAITSHGETHWKADPFAFESERDPKDDIGGKASRITGLAYGRRWSDQDWLKSREGKNFLRSPMNIYEVHVGSWKRKPDGSVYNYHEMAEELIPYVKDMGYTHIELLPLTEYPFEGSWGYQVTGYYSITSRYGTPEMFMEFVEAAHEAGIGVIMDWVPAHFPKDEFGLYEFDGYPLYEDSDPLKMEHKGWGTRAFDFGRPEVQSFLISSACFLCDVYHIDGLRFDAVAAMLYLNYDRQDGEWRPNIHGGTENLEAVDFLRNVNQAVHHNFPGVFVAAEESTAWPMVTMPPEDGGLGFNFKWNMGWMNDTLSYFETDPVFRQGCHHKLTFSLMYAFSENFILPISHDEVVHGKKSLLDKMPGSYEEKFQGLRAFFLYMMTHPGKKLLFMGSEFGQFIEWNENQGLDWVLLDYEKHRGVQDFVKDLNHFYKNSTAMWALDDTYDGFQWIDADNASDNVYSYYRTDGAEKNPRVDVVILNLSGQDYVDFGVKVPDALVYERILDSDEKKYGGNGLRTSWKYKPEKREKESYIYIDLPARSGVILEARGLVKGVKDE